MGRNRIDILHWILFWVFIYPNPATNISFIKAFTRVPFSLPLIFPRTSSAPWPKVAYVSSLLQCSMLHEHIAMYCHDSISGLLCSGFWNLTTWWIYWNRNMYIFPENEKRDQCETAVIYYACPNTGYRILKNKFFFIFIKMTLYYI